jgi:hypothetical protein
MRRGSNSNVLGNITRIGQSRDGPSIGEEEEEGKRYKRKKEIGSHRGAIMIYFG